MFNPPTPIWIEDLYCELLCLFQMEQLQQDMLVQQGTLKDHSLVLGSLDRNITLCDSTLTTLQVKKLCYYNTVQKIYQQTLDFHSCCVWIEIWL